MSFYNNYVEQCNKVDKSPSAAAEEMGFQRSVITRWKNGAVPRQATLQKIASYFGCTLYELTKDFEPEKEKPAQESGLSVDEIKNAFRGKSFEELTEILAALTDELKNTK